MEEKACELARYGTRPSDRRGRRRRPHHLAVLDVGWRPVHRLAGVHGRRHRDDRHRRTRDRLRGPAGDRDRTVSRPRPGSGRRGHGGIGLCSRVGARAAVRGRRLLLGARGSRDHLGLLRRRASSVDADSSPVAPGPPSSAAGPTRVLNFRRTRVRWPEWVVAGSALVLLIAIFALKWYSVGQQSVNGWHGVSHLRWLMLITIVAAFALLLFQATRPSPAIPVTLSLFVTLVGAGTVI